MQNCKLFVTYHQNKMRSFLWQAFIQSNISFMLFVLKCFARHSKGCTSMCLPLAIIELFKEKNSKGKKDWWNLWALVVKSSKTSTYFPTHEKVNSSLPTENWICCPTVWRFLKNISLCKISNHHLILRKVVYYIVWEIFRENICSKL